MMKNLSYERKVFVIFLLVQLILFTAVSMIRLVMPTDALEGIYWGSLHDFGTPKHPPLAGWITYITFLIFKKDFFVYLISQIFILVGLIFTYKTAKLFLNETESILSVITLSAGCWVYGYITSYYGFNPDVILLCVLPMITYLGYKAVYDNKTSNWIILGVIVGLSCLNKYQTALVLLPLIIWAGIFKKEIFKTWKPYLSMLIAFFIFLPHLLWLVKYDFFPVLYFEGELTDSGWLNHITAPLIFILVQLGAIAGSIVLFTVLKLKQKSNFKFLNFDDKQKAWFLILIGLVPFIIHVCMGFAAGGTMRPRWGFEFLYLTTIMLFYFFPIKEISADSFKFIVKLSFIAILLTSTVMATLFAVEKNYRSRYPVEKITSDLVQDWNSKFNSPLKYIGGYIEWFLPLVIYNPDKNFDCILDTKGYPNPWITENDLKKHGAIIIDRTKEGVIGYAGDIKYVKQEIKDIEPKEYSFFVKNAFGMPREYTIYYYMVAPQQ